MVAEWVNPLISGAAGLFGVGIGAGLGSYAEARRRQAGFAARQLKEFYGALLGLRAAIRAHSELRLKLQAAQDEAWGKVVALAREDDGADVIQKLREGPLGQKFSAMIDEESRNFREVLFPWYQEMVKLFRENISLADPQTRSRP